ncbi:hypothetical protein KVT40_008564 [Elsinoe batatas]|uniref:Major facilitator superfamily (MFS) profile domain-containing protein n=1 Tax=Elsinoe batatas TaxID=2601811 RepID=A0A8K0L0I9_9PEZI|nr:hypothetical protein KVT40_008564 [Elsinoe batatas]
MDRDVDHHASTPVVTPKPEHDRPGREIQTAHLELMTGWRLWLTIGCLAFGLLLSALETTIIATALVSITSNMGSYDKGNWIVTAYLVTYAGFLIVFARLSDLFGRKGTLITAYGLFTTFSLACGLSRTIDQLIVFRALQGVGGSGLYSLALAVMTEITPMKHIGAVTGLMGSIFATSSVLGPILGGLITSNTTWRWVFLLNVPPGVTAIVILIVWFPRNCGPLPIGLKTFKAIDSLGIATSLAGSVLILFSLESGGVVYSWQSASIIAPLAVGGACMIAFAVWQWTLSKERIGLTVLSLFPADLATRRVIGFTMLTAFLLGFPFMITIVFLPQRFQLQNNLSPSEAGIRMLALLLASAIGAGVSGLIVVKHNISWYLLFLAICLQIVGLALMSTLPVTSGTVTTAQYGYQVDRHSAMSNPDMSLRRICLARSLLDHHAILTYPDPTGIGGTTCRDNHENAGWVALGQRWSCHSLVTRVVHRIRHVLAGYKHDRVTVYPEELYLS